MNEQKCPEKQRLADYSSGKLPEVDAAKVADHLAECRACEATIESLEASSDTLGTGLRDAPPKEPFVDETGYKQAVGRLNELPAGKKPEPSPPAAPAAKSAPSAADKPTTSKPNPKLGPYKLLTKLGEGGMGAVYKALHEHLEKVVAIKVLPKKAMQDPAAVARFRREMKAVGALHHPNIVGAHDAGEAGGIHYLVMEYVEGRDLSNLVKKHGPLPIDKSVSYVMQAAKGLAFAHGKGIVHRDIKPANLLVDAEGTLKILDMGLARLDSADPASAAAQDGLTQTGQVMGTIDYMAPEQAFDTHKADAKADVYSLGCTLYRLLTGHNMFAADTLVKKILAHREQPPPPLADARPEVPPTLELLYQQMVAKRPENRPTMTEVAAALEAIQRGGGSAAAAGPLADMVGGDAMAAAESQRLRGVSEELAQIEPAASRKKPAPATRHKHRTAAAGGRKKPPLKVLLGTGGAAALILCGILIIVRGKDGKVDSQTYVRDDQRVELVPGATGMRALTEKPAEKNLPPAAIVARPAGDRVSPVSTGLVGSPPKDDAPGEVGRIALEKGARNVFLALLRDGLHVAVYTDYRVRLYEIASGRMVWDRTITPSPYARALAASPDGKLLALAGNQGATARGVVFLLRTVDGATIRTLDFEFPVGSAAFSPGGNLLAFGMDSGPIQLIDADTGSARRALSGHKTGVMGLAFSPDGKRLVSGAVGTKGDDRGDTKVRLWDVATGSEIALLKQIENITHSSFAFSDDGRWLLAGTFNSAAVLWDAAAGENLGYIMNPRSQAVPGVAMLPSGRHALCRSHALLLAEIPSRKILQEFGEPSAVFIRDLGVTPDGRLAITAGEKEEFLRVWRLPQMVWSSSAADTALATSAPAIGASRPLRAKPITTFNDPTFQQWLKATQALPAEKQIEAVSKKLMELNPGFNGKIAPVIRGGVVVELSFPAEQVTDLSPVRALTGLTTLSCRGSNNQDPAKLADLSPLQGMPLQILWCENTRVADLSPLTGMKLTRLHLSYTQVSDLSPLRGMPLNRLSFGSTLVSDLSALAGMPLNDLRFSGTRVLELSPLKGMPLTILECYTTRVSDLSPLAGMRLTGLNCYATLVSDLAPLSGMPLTNLDFHATQISDLSPLKGMPLKKLTCYWSKVSDLSPLEGMSLTEIALAPRSITKGLDVIRRMKSLQSIAADAGAPLPPADFWKKYDAGDFGKPAAPAKLAYLDPAFQKWIADTQKLPAEQQIEAVSKKLSELNPGFDGKLAGMNMYGPPDVRRGMVSVVRISSPDHVADISPLRVFGGMTDFVCGGVGHRGILSDLSPLQGMPLVGLSVPVQPVSDLSPLSGMKLEALKVGNTDVNDLSPVRGMPLTQLECYGTQITDLSPCDGMPLTQIFFTLKNVTQGLEVLRRMNSLKTIAIGMAPNQRFTPDEFWKKYDAGGFGKPAAAPAPQPSPVKGEGAKAFNDPAFQQWMKQIAALPAEKQIEAVSKKLMELNPGFDGKVTRADGSAPPEIENGVVRQFRFGTENVTNISPVRALDALQDLSCTGNSMKGALSDLSPLRGMKFTDLNFSNTRVSDLSPLEGMHLTRLTCGHTLVSDLSPLQDCKSLTSLKASKTKVTAAGVATLQKALPNCKIEWNEAYKAPSPGPLPAREPE